MGIQARRLSIATICFSAFAIGSPASATAPLYGAMSYSTARDCSTTAASDPCDGTLLGQEIFTDFLAGGPGTTSSASLTLLDGSYAYGDVSFGALDLPLLHAATDAVGNVRMNSNQLGYQSYDYTGPSGTPFSLSGNLHIVDASGSPLGGVLPDGAVYTAYLAIWDPSVVTSITSATDILNRFFYAPCGTPGVLAATIISGDLSGASSFGMTTESCSGSPLLLSTGDQVLAVAGSQLPVNRGGYADASSTFTVALDPALPTEAITNLTAGLVSAQVQGVPEPGTWATMLLGFAAMGLFIRKRRGAITELA